MKQEELFKHFKGFIHICLENPEEPQEEIIKAYEIPLNEEEKAHFILFQIAFWKMYTKQLNAAMKKDKSGNLKELDHEELEAIILDSFNRSKIKDEEEFKPQGEIKNEI